jgi:hypothetical protein
VIAVPIWTFFKTRRLRDWLPHGRGSASDVKPVLGQLENLNRRTEQDFLTVGNALMELSSSARRIAADMSLLTELISGAQGRAATAALERVAEHSRAMQVRIESNGQALGKLRDLSGRLRQGFCGLTNRVATYRTLCTLTRIETSRLGSSGGDFGDLADQVRPLSEAIQASGEALVEAASVLDESVDSSLRKVEGLRARQLRELPRLVATAGEGMRAFARRRAQAAEASIRQSAEYETLCAAVDDLVRAIQFHDITRQQIEHVGEALRLTLSGSRPTRALLLLQASQLESAGRVFASAVEGIEGDLNAVATRLQSMAEACRSLLGVEESEKASFFLRMQGCFAEILQAVTACATAGAEMTLAARAVEEPVERMRVSIGEIRSIETRVQRIAINATIRAAHLGTAGDPLSAIADAMQRMLVASSATTDDAAGHLAAIGEEERSLTSREAFGDAEESGRGLQQAIREMQTASDLSDRKVRRFRQSVRAWRRV